MTQSKTSTESYVRYLVFEIIMLSVITFLGSAIFLFYILGKSDVRNETRNLEYFFDETYLFICLALIPTVIALTFLLYFRNRNYIIAYQFDDTKELLEIGYRTLTRKTIYRTTLPYSLIVTEKINEKKFLFNESYKGVRIIEKQLKLDFITNNFIWEKQAREKVHFLQELNRIKS